MRILRFTLLFFLIAIKLLLISGPAKAQLWPKLYGDTLSSIFQSSLEDYDKGFLFAGNQYHYFLGGYAYGWLLKTDINGNQLWAKSYGFPQHMVNFQSIASTPGQGVILAGGTNKRNPSCTEPFIIKVNTCGEKEWCRIYDAQECNSFCMGIVSLTDGGSVALFNNWKAGPTKIVWLLRLNSIGEITWQQAYCTNPEYRDEVANSLVLTSDSNLVITGNTYYIDSLYPGFQVLKIFHVKTALDGTVIWDAPWGNNEGVISDAMNSIEGNSHSIYTPGRRGRDDGDSPCLFKTSGMGQSLYYRDILDSTSRGYASVASSFIDGTLAMVAQWQYPTSLDTTGIFKTDTLGNILNRKIVTTESWCAFSSAFRTYNNRQVFSGTLNEKAVVMKVNDNLQWDSIYTMPFLYDSLCPHSIATDTVSLDNCTVITAIYSPQKDLEKTRLRIFPNPACEHITIDFPRYVFRNFSTPGGVMQTIYHQWPSAELQILDLSGKVVYSTKANQDSPPITIIIESWKTGMYMARLVFMNEVTASAKFMVER